MIVDKWPHNYQLAKDAPSPERTSIYFVRKIPGTEFISDSVREPVLPYKRHNSHGQPAEHKAYQAVMHRMLPVPRRCDPVDFYRDF